MRESDPQPLASGRVPQASEATFCEISVVNRFEIFAINHER